MSHSHPHFDAVISNVTISNAIPDTTRGATPCA